MPTMKKRIDICVVVDCSESLVPQANNINKALRETIFEIKTNEDLFGREVYFSLIPFADHIIKDQCIEFEPIENIKDDIKLTFDGHTNPGEALSYITEKALSRYYDWRSHADECYHPLIFFFTDGVPYPVKDYQELYENTASKIKGYENDYKLFVFGAAFGPDADIENMKRITNHPGRILNIESDDAKQCVKMLRDVVVRDLYFQQPISGLCSYEMLDRIFELFFSDFLT